MNTAAQYSEKYTSIIEEVNDRCKQLHQEHRSHTMCRKGCSQCCMNFSVLPIEFFSILEKIKDRPLKLNRNEKENCIFLIDNVCQIYDHRPSICRSHGLPILNMDEEGENWELSFCPLNFTKADDNYFTLENGFQQDLYNSKLYTLNLDFIKMIKAGNYKASDLIPLGEFYNYL